MESPHAKLWNTQVEGKHSTEWRIRRFSAHCSHKNPIAAGEANGFLIVGRPREMNVLAPESSLQPY